MWSRGPEAQHHSLRRRLLALVLAAVALGSVLQATSAYRTAVRHADALFDGQLQALARAVEAGVPLAGSGGSFDYEVQVWGPGGVLLFGTRGARLPVAPVVGFSEVQAGGVRYRVFSLSTPGRTIQIAQDLDARRARAGALALDAVLPVALVGLLLMGAVWWVIERSLAPVSRLRRQLAARQAQDLAPLPEAGLPQEVLPLVRDLNHLFGRVEQAFQSQQRFVADAAHELRSPLAALRLQAQALERDAPGRGEAVQALLQGIDRATALVAQLLALAREEGQAPAALAPVPLQDLARETVADVLPQAAARGIDLGLAEGAAQATVQGEREALRTLLRNLLDNAVKFTPPGGRVDISVGTEGGATTVAVDDSGPGIPASERERVFDRFWRGSAGEVPGSGLGLAIVAAIARRHGAQVSLHDSPRLGGLRAEVRFPPPA